MPKLYCMRYLYQLIHSDGRSPQPGEREREGHERDHEGEERGEIIDNERERETEF